MISDIWVDLTRGKRFVSDVGKSIYGIDSKGTPCVVGRYAVWYPVPENKENPAKQTHQIVEIDDDLNRLLSKHSISASMVYRMA